MNDQQWFNRLALLAVTVVVLAGTFGLLAQSRSASSGSGSLATSGGSTDYLYLTIAFNPVTGLDELFPGNFSVPIGAPVVVTITNYDNGTNLVAPVYGSVAGVQGNVVTAWVNGSPTSTEYHALPTTGIAHTFTIDQSGVSVNVPIPPAGPTGAPTTVQFTTEFNSSGSFVWNCMAPCDDNSMATMGMMAGMVYVE